MDICEARLLILEGEENDNAVANNSGTGADAANCNGNSGLNNYAGGDTFLSTDNGTNEASPDISIL